MFNRTKINMAALAALGASLALPALPALAQTTPSASVVEITGSRIKRTDTETALPIVVLRAADLESAGVKTVEAALQFIAQNQSLINSSRSIGSTNGGAAYADLRALGVERTLVLLNGQRIVKNPYSGIATDLNTIPTVAIDRIEVLTDGASSIYGTDAIAGVINIITKRDFNGVELGASVKLPSGEGGKQYSGNILGGFGSLAKDGFNIYGGFSYTREDPIAAVQRDFAKSGIIPDKGVYLTSGTSFPGNYSQSATGVSTNPTLPNCVPPRSILIPGIFGPNSCRYDFTSNIDIMSDVERYSVFGKGTLALGSSNTASIEYFRSYNSVANNVAPTPLTGLQMLPNSPFYPGNGATAITNTRLDRTRPISVGWRMEPAGKRASEIENTTQRGLAEVFGLIGSDWDYRVTANYSDSNVTNTFTDGYVSRQGIINGIQGINGAPFLNPFGPQGAGGVDYIVANKITGEMQDIKGTQYGVNASVSGTAMRLPAGPLGIAASVEYRKEDIKYRNNFTLIRQAASSGLELTEDTTGNIRNYGVGFEANIPVLKGLPFVKSLEIPVSVRYDNYDRSGNSTNPKVGLRWQVNDPLLVRGSINRGFRAPGVFDLFAPNSITFSSNSYDDPVLCPGGTAVTGADPGRDCGQQFRTLQGGNQSTKPEKSEAWSAGFVFDIAAGISVSFDYFNYKVKGTIGSLPETAIFGDVPRYANKFVRCSTLSPAAAGAIDACVPGVVDPLAYIITTTDNLGDIKSSGFDVGFNLRNKMGGAGTLTFSLNGTYLTKWEQQLVAGGEYFSALGRYSVDLNFPAPRWQHVARIGWETGPISVNLFNRYKRGYQDYNLDTLDDDVFGKNVTRPWSVFDVSASYTGIKGLTLTVAVQNLFDKAPPFSNQNATFQSGYDPRIADPVGRALFLQAGYKF